LAEIQSHPAAIRNRETHQAGTPDTRRFQPRSPLILAPVLLIKIRHERPGYTMETYELLVLLTVGAVSPYLTEAIFSWIRRFGRSHNWCVRTNLIAYCERFGKSSANRSA
jgi:hypothetical protein